MSGLETEHRDPLDAVLRRQLSAELDGQLGRAEAAFLRHLAARPSPGQGREGSEEAARAAPPHRPGMRFRGWVFTTVGTALAASIAGFLAAPRLLGPAPAAAPGGPSVSSPAQGRTAAAVVAPSHYVHNLRSRTWDEGPVILRNQVPARRVRREEVERAEWYYLEQGVRMELTVPRQETQFLELDTY